MKSKSKPSYLLDVVVAQGAAILELFAGEDQTLLVRRNALLVLDLGLDVVDGVARLDVEGNGLTRQGLDETISSRISPYSIMSCVGLAGYWWVRGNGVCSSSRPTSALKTREKRGCQLAEFTRGAGMHFGGSLQHILVASFRWCRRSVAVFEAEEAMTM